MKMFGTIFTLWLALIATAAELTIIHTADTHGRLKATPEVKQAFEAEKSTNTILIDCGDTIQGTYEAMLDKGSAAVAALNELDFDVWVAGNHDMDYGAESYNARRHEFKGAALAGNWNVDGEQLPGWKLFELEGVRVAVIGLGRSDQALRSYHPDFTMETIEDAAALYRIMKEVRAAAPDVTVLARHAGDYDRTGNLWYLASAFPEIDLVLGGHTHKADPGSTACEVFYAQAGKHAECFGVVKIDYNEEAKKVEQISGKLVWLPVAAPEPDASKPVTTYPCNIVLPAKKSTKNLLCAIGADAMQNELAADAGFYGTTLKNAVFPQEVTEKSLFDMFPFEDEAVILPLSRAQFAAVIEEQIAQHRQSSYSPYFSGVKVIADANGKVVVIDPEKSQYRLALSSFAAVGGNGKFPVLAELSPRAERTKLTVRACVAKRIRRHRAIPVPAWLLPKNQ